MANDEHVIKLIYQSPQWNDWRRENPDVTPDLSGADLSLATCLRLTAPSGLLSPAFLGGYRPIDWREINLSGANLRGTNLSGQMLVGADLSNADLTDADLTHTHFVSANLAGADLSDCHVFGVSAWNVNTEGANQSSLVITPIEEAVITVDNLEVAQFIYLLLNNAKIRDVIDTLTSKAVLILGRFKSERKAVLDAIRDALRARGYLPLLFDFEGPSRRNLTETVTTLARMSRFIVADITEASSIPQELYSIVSQLPSVPVQPLLLDSEREYAMFRDLQHYPWVLETFRYTSAQDAIAQIGERTIEPCERYLAKRAATTRPL
jgi:hypothetical protein